MKSSFLFLLLATAILFSSCSQVSVDLGGRRDRRFIEERQSFYLWGIAGEKTLIMKDYCDNGQVSYIEDMFTGTDVLLHIVTLGIYAPRTSKIYCRLN